MNIKIIIIAIIVFGLSSNLSRAECTNAFDLRVVSLNESHIPALAESDQKIEGTSFEEAFFEYASFLAEHELFNFTAVLRGQVAAFISIKVAKYALKLISYTVTDTGELHRKAVVEAMKDRVRVLANDYRKDRLIIQVSSDETDAIKDLLDFGFTHQGDVTTQKGTSSRYSLTFELDEIPKPLNDEEFNQFIRNIR